MRWVLAAAVVGSTFSGAVTRGAEPNPPPQVASLVRDLGSTDFAARQAADEHLARLGGQVRNELELALNAEDVEVRLRAERLLNRIKAAELWSPSIVDVRLLDAPAVKGFETLAEQSQNPLTLSDPRAAASNALVSLPTGPTEFWRTVDELCRRSGNHVRPNFDSQSPGLVVAAGPPGEFPTAYSGPLRAQITSARRMFTEELDYEASNSAVTHTFQLNLRIMWEDRFRLIAHAGQPVAVEALGDAGKPLGMTPSSGANWNVITPGMRQITANLRLTPPARAAKKLTTLRLRWGLVAVGEFETAELTPVVAKQRLQRSDLLATIESLERQASGRCEISLLIARELALPEPQEILLEENQVSLWDQRGRRYRLLSQSNSLSDRGAMLKLSFSGESADCEPTSLKISYPKLRSRRDLEIVFRDVPLPAAQPE
jgi:hypothetical protein